MGAFLSMATRGPAIAMTRRTPNISRLVPEGRPPSPARRYAPLAAIGALVGVTVGLGLTQIPVGSVANSRPVAGFDCGRADVIDGMTLQCGSRRVALAGIAAADDKLAMASAANLRTLVAAGKTVCLKPTTDRAGNALARCEAAGRDLSCAQVKQGLVRRRDGLVCN